MVHKPSGYFIVRGVPHGMSASELTARLEETVSEVASVVLRGDGAAGVQFTSAEASAAAADALAGLDWGGDQPLEVDALECVLDKDGALDSYLPPSPVAAPRDEAGGGAAEAKEGEPAAEREAAPPSPSGLHVAVAPDAFDECFELSDSEGDGYDSDEVVAFVKVVKKRSPVRRRAAEEEDADGAPAADE